MEGNYPSDENLEILRKWSHDDIMGMMEFVEDLWRYPEWGFTRHEEQNEYIFELHTGGWSGNEELLSALQENGVFWSLCWEQSRRGGHHIFKVRKRG